MNWSAQDRTVTALRWGCLGGGEIGTQGGRKTLSSVWDVSEHQAEMSITCCDAGIGQS